MDHPILATTTGIGFLLLGLAVCGESDPIIFGPITCFPETPRCIDDGFVPLQILTASALIDGAKNVVYSQTLIAAGGEGSYTWALASGSGPLPAGVSLSTDGVISGPPTVVGTCEFTVEVTSADVTIQKAFSITVDET